MNRKLLSIILAALLFSASLCGCAGCKKTRVTVRDLPAPGTTAVQDETVTFAPPGTEASAAATETTGAAAPVQTAQETAAAIPSVSAGETTAPAAPSASAAEAVTLPIELPVANGTMDVSVDPQNTFIRTISESRGISASLLAAVYSIPPSGQNYVFEFTGAGDRSADSLRRVYLLTDDLQIKSVAASSAAEREQISLTENWFCMNVLIKGVIFPSVQEKMQ